jgi:hypothetical protein
VRKYGNKFYEALDAFAKGKAEKKSKK